MDLCLYLIIWLSLLKQPESHKKNCCLNKCGMFKYLQLNAGFTNLFLTLGSPSGCFAFWCFPCFACKTSSQFGESLCLPLVDILGPAMMAATGVGLCVPPVTLSMRVAIRYKYHIPVSAVCLISSRAKEK